MAIGICAEFVIPFGEAEEIKKRVFPLSNVASKVASPRSSGDKREVSLFEGAGIADSADLKKQEQRDEETEWIFRATEGDMDAFRKLFERYYMRLRSVAFGILSNEEDAADVCQEAFFKAYKNLSTFRGQSSFYTWMYRIVYNLCIDLGRKSSRKREVPTAETSVFEQGVSRPHSEYFIPASTSPEEHAYRGELGDQIRHAMDQLSPSHRAVIVLRELEGLSYDEISQSLGCSVGTVMSRLYHARKKLCVVLEQAMEEVSEKGVKINDIR
jgi:RNA polymerase sigma-70 factor, ECF subfamily